MLLSLLLACGEEPLEPGTMLTLTLNGGLSEGPGFDLMAELTGQKSLSLWDVRQTLRAANDDDAIGGLLLDVKDAQLGSAALDELADELERFDKPVHALIQTDLIEEPELSATMGADKVWVNPETMWLVNGVQVDVTFLRGVFDKIHVKPEWIMFKEYKSAGEPYQNHEMSDAMREALTDVIGDLQDHLVSSWIERRGIDRAKLEAAMARGIFHGEDAKDAGLVDELGYVDQVRDALMAEAGADEWNAMSLGAYAGRLAKEDKVSGLMPKDDESAEPKIAVVFGEGPIVAASSGDPWDTDAKIYGPKIAADIRDAREDDDVKAIVFRVNSPGGSAVGSDLIWREIELAQEAGKPVVVSMGDLAGSGGYWVSMGADAIVARPGTITGSIGVVFGKFDLSGLYEWAGANVESMAFAPNSDVLSPYRSMSDDQRASIERTIEHLYEHFKAKVADGRGIAIAEMEEKAKGRIWSGKDAVGKGLVDELGGLDTAIALAREKAGVSDDIEVVAWPAPKPLLEQILEGELGVQTPELGAEAQLEALFRDLEEPRIWAIMPDFRLR